MLKDMLERAGRTGERALNWAAEKKIVPESTVARVSHVGERTLQWVGNAVERRLNTENFIVANQTPFEIIHQNGLLTVRKYAPLTEDEIPVGDGTLVVRKDLHRIPVLLIPPLAADPLNFDLFPNRSLVKFLLAHGYRVYLADFGSPDEDHSHLGFADYATRMIPEALEKVRADSAQKEVSLLGYCMGGLFCLIYAAWAQDPNLKNIVTIASPIDAHQAGIAGKLWTVMRTPVKLVRKYTGFRIHNIDPGKMNVPGWLASLTFKMTAPMSAVTGYIDLLMNLWDREYVTEYQTMATWFNKMHDYPGGIVQDLVVRLGMDNAMSSGSFDLGKGKDGAAKFDRINCSLLAIAGKTDKIVVVEAARKVMDIVSSEDKTFELAPGGHAGVFAGSKAPATTWTIAANWLATRSDAPITARRAVDRRAPAKKAVHSRARPKKKSSKK
ncbi:MAG: alpha/beta fold hydrolase [Stenotrophobium sp.]